MSKKCADNQLKKILDWYEKHLELILGIRRLHNLKANITEWASLINQMQENAKESDGTFKTKNEINKENEELYKELAVNISILRNERIRSSIAKICKALKLQRGMKLSLYIMFLCHLKKGHDPEIHVGETAYDQN